MASKLEELGKQFRIDNTKGNTYQNEESKKYSSTHPNALSDGDVKGKGSGDELDTYNGGSDIDINGNPNYPGSGRKQLIARNEAKVAGPNGPNGYGPNKPYTHPDTDGNVGQFRVS
jgi:hypothetical protein